MNTYEKDILDLFHLDLPWSNLLGTNILIAGATGLIGGCLVETLMKNPRRNYNVYALGRNECRAYQRFSEFSDDKAFHFLKFDVTKPLDKEIHFDYIIHTASDANPKSYVTQPVEVMKANLNGVINMMEYGLAHDMKRFLYISSGEIYGEGNGGVLREDYSGYVDCMKPRSCYPSSKRAAETLCVSYIEEYGVDAVIARPCHVYGPNFTENDSRVYAQFIRNILNGSDILMKSNGQQFRSWCYVVDCVSALFYILLKGEKGQAYNIADKTSSLTIKELAEMMARIGGKKVEIVVPQNSELKGYNVVSNSIFSTEKLESLGWSVNGSMEEKLRKTILFERDRYGRDKSL